MNLLMSAILHDPRFQALEAAWRSLQFLASRLETKESLKLYLLDISKEDLSAELLKADDFRKSAVYHAIVEDTLQVPDAEPWALLVGNYGFDRNDEQDLQLLERMGLLGRAAGAPFLAQCVLSSSGNTRAVRFWKELRRSSYAGYLGLAVPRVLLRLPYGLETRRIDSFAFEEMPAHRHEQYLWGNPAFACASLLAGGFAGNGWKFGEGAMREIHGLPMHVYNAGRGRGIQPCAEMALTEGECDQLLREGFMPLYASRDRDVLKVVSFQSIAEPQAPLSGRWGE
jgi:type VI secretion system protein ImpC